MLSVGYVMVYSRQYVGQKNGYLSGGILYLGSEVLGYVLEPDKLTSVERQKGYVIPPGDYSLATHMWKGRRRRPLLYKDDVPKSRCILMHEGNVPSDSAGCLLLGEKAKFDEQGRIISVHNCAAVVDRVLTLIDSGVSTLTITTDFKSKGQ